MVGDPGPAWGPRCCQQRQPGGLGQGPLKPSHPVLGAPRPGRGGRGLGLRLGAPSGPKEAGCTSVLGGCGTKGPVWNTPGEGSGSPAGSQRHCRGMPPRAGISGGLGSLKLCPALTLGPGRPEGWHLPQQHNTQAARGPALGTPQPCTGAPVSPASGAGPDDSPRSKTRAGSRWLGRGMVRPEGARRGVPGTLGSWVGTLPAYEADRPSRRRGPSQPRPPLMGRNIWL